MPFSSLFLKPNIISHKTVKMEESKTKPIPLTESELLKLQTGMFDAIQKTDPNWTQSPNTTNILNLKEPMEPHGT